MRRAFLVILAVLATACLPEKTDGSRNGLSFEKQSVRIVRQDLPDVGLTVEIADTNAKRARGLMYRSELADDAGMLFLFPVRKRISMWMANTIVPLDMIFIDEYGKVREIVENTVPFSRDEVRSKDSVSAVLEIKAGQSKRLNIRSGDVIVHPFFKLEKAK
ncbi:MAG: DUF192 domain-containing protein [Alphaproteobacteria bacterium]|nr:DUF192 domain-containing protein [Alphaproteobacteria bacterium]